LNKDPARELSRAITAITKAKDVVDLLTVLLKICRTHAGEVMDAGADPNRRALREGLKDAAFAKFTSRVLTKETRDFVIDKLKDPAFTLPEAARGLAMGIDLAVQDRFPTAYRELLAKGRAARELRKGDPYPVPLNKLQPMYGDAEFSRRRRLSKDATSFDCVDGLALWNRASGAPCRVIYDPTAGERLDASLGSAITILAVAPNDSVDDIHFGKFGRNTFFGVRAKDAAKQDTLLARALAGAVKYEADILVTPELSDAPNTVTDWATPSAGGTRPRIIVAGGAHLDVGVPNGHPVNRLNTIYTGPNPLVVPHDKIGRFAISAGEKGPEFEEEIFRGRELRIHAGTEWSMIVLICADFLEPSLVHVVADLYPRLVIVASMSGKTGDYPRNADTVVTQSQALVVVVNGPSDWSFDPKKPVPRVPVALIGMPLADVTAAHPQLTPSTPAGPHAILFRSLQRTAQFVPV
jgi:hypothetical protein